MRTSIPTLLAVLALGWLAAPPAAGQEQGLNPPPEEAVELGRRAFNEGWMGPEYPWYNAESDGLRPVEVKPPRRRTSWQPAAWLSPLIAGLGWGVLALIVAIGAAVLVWAFVSRDPRSTRDSVSLTEDQASRVDRVEALPFQVNRPAGDLLAEARRCYEAGNYGEAVVYLFSHQLLELDKNQWIRLARGKTNRQYLRELRQRPDLGRLLEQTMVAFEDFFFGNHPVERRRFEACWRQLDEFHRLATAR